VRKITFLLPAVVGIVASMGAPARAQFASGLYVSNVNTSGAGEVDLVPGSNGAPTQIVSGLIAPTGIGFSADGQFLYVADAGTDTLNVYNNSGGAAHLINSVSLATATGGGSISSSSPADLTVDSAGNVFIAMHTQTAAGQSIVEVQSAATAPSVSVFLSTQIPGASGLTNNGSNLYLGSNGGIYGGVANGGKVYEVSGGVATRFPTGVTFGQGAAGLTTDGHYLYIAETTSGGGRIIRVDLTTETRLNLSTALSFAPTGITLDSNGNLYFDDKNGDVYEITNAAGRSSAATPTLFNNTLEASETAGGGPTYAAFTPGPPGTPEPGSLAMSGVVVLVGLAGFGWKRRRQAKAAAASDAEPVVVPVPAEV
jgi:sugar lactone lactonase YvrE